MNNTVEFLKQVRATIDEPSKWCQKHYAADKDGKFAYIDSEEAVKWCLIGAMLKVDQERRSGVYQAAFNAIERSIKYPASYNDTHSHSQVLAVLDKAIKRSTGWRRFIFW